MHKIMSKQVRWLVVACRACNAVADSSVHYCGEASSRTVLMQHGAPRHVCTLTQSCDSHCSISCAPPMSPGSSISSSISLPSDR